DISTNDIANINPYTYRGYRLDYETGYYYLQSRYYNPSIGRFVSSDGILGEVGNIKSNNMYAYCANNPIMYVDPRGCFWDTVFDVLQIGWGLYDFIKSQTWENFGCLALDIVFAAVLFLIGRSIVKGASILDYASDFTGYIMD
ncbi:MAG: RHS repeat-associated core domain-containing protein, partial [Candidatus Izemoplasmatales bacterium]|nr:RHS repeat-associated core domain-containing protein [Candidatus Izemoplasmatales bacterium]